MLGRWQILGNQPKIVCDSAHNREGLTLVLEQIAQQEFKNLHIVLGFVKDKKLATVLPLFPKKAIYYFCKPDIQRGLVADSLTNEAVGFGLNGEVYNSVLEAQNAAKNAASKSDLIFIGGSNFVVAEVV